MWYKKIAGEYIKHSEEVCKRVKLEERFKIGKKEDEGKIRD